MGLGTNGNGGFNSRRFVRFYVMDGCGDVGLFALVVVVALFANPAACAQSAELQSGSIKVEGTIRNATGDPIVGASVSLEENKHTGVAETKAETKTKADGSFVVSATRGGVYTLRAGKPGLQSVVMGPLSLAAGEQKHFNLVLDVAAEGQGRGPGSSSPEAMEFEDKPNFTVAGITDWTAVGGHGADTNLRTSEDLAKETLALKSDDIKSEAVKEPVPKRSESNESETKLKAALMQDPRSFEANHRLGEFYLASGQYAQAIPLLQAGNQINSANYSNQYDLALAYKAAGDFVRASEQVRSMLANGDKAELRRTLGDIDEQLNDPLGAVREYEQAVQLDPNEENYFRWGTELLLHRAIPPAVEVFSKGATAHPGSARMLEGLGAALYASGSYDQAALKVCAASDMVPSDSGPYIFLGQMERAAPAPLPCVDQKLARFAHDQQENALANYYYAMALWKRQHEPADPAASRQVEALLDKAASLNPQLAEAYLQLGILYSAEGNLEKAVSSFKKAIADNPHLGEAHYRLAVIYQRIGDDSKAQQEFKLHDDVEKSDAAEVERKRREIRQFLVVLKGQPQASQVH